MKEKNQSNYFRKAVRATKNKQGKEHNILTSLTTIGAAIVSTFKRRQKKKNFFFICELILTEANEALNFFSDGGSHLNV